MLDLDGSDSGPEILTPESETGSQSQPLTLINKTLEHTFIIPTFLYANAIRLRDRFLKAITNSEGLGNGIRSPSSVIELVAEFLGFITKEFERSIDPSFDREVLNFVLQSFEREVLHNEEVHAFVAPLPEDVDKLMVIRSYYLAVGAVRRTGGVPDSALMRAALKGTARIYAVFGGQGNTKTYLDELRDVYDTYPSLTRRFLVPAARYLERLSRDARASQAFAHGLDIMRWLEQPDSQPDLDYLVSAPVSFPLIGLLQILHYIVTTSSLGTHPGGMRNRLSGTTGHSQGVILAAIISASADWHSLETQGKKALTILFWIGVRSQEAYPLPSIAPSALTDSIAHGEGEPTAALSIRGIGREALEKHITNVNRALPEDRQIVIALVNGAKNFVVAGPPMALYGLNVQLRKVKASENVDESRIPFSQRKLHINNKFLPITAPFHSPYLRSAIEALQDDLKETKISPSELDIPVYSTFSGKDIRNELHQKDDIVPSLVKMICEDPVHWDRVIEMSDATHILDFGPGRTAGVAGLTSRIKDGTGARVILATNITNPTHPEIGCKHEIFARKTSDLAYGANWAKQYGPKLIKTSSDQIFVDTKMSRLLGLPPIMVAGMTPTTVHWDFVVAGMKAGYEVELACGGYYDASSLTDAITKISKEIPPGRGIVLNVIYASPKSIAWQIPLVRDLCAKGLPIKGLTIGAGVPSLDVANEYIRTLGIRQIGFKPGSIQVIQQVIKIAQANPGFPIIMQWTGGRGGGHHSCEDFHEPILEMYSKIRRCANVVLVAGSGFGGAEDTYPYLSGSWATKFGSPPMPFDGVLFGSRCMVAKEAHTSQGAKQAIVDAQGLSDQEWEKTYRKPGGGGGVITVKSEMGEPIHKLATRGVILWAEMDQKIFSLPKEKRLLELKKKTTRDYIIRKLNADFQKPWFGRTTSGTPVDLEDMTYSEVVSRMIEFMFIKHQKRWIDKSLARLTGDFIRYVEQRLATHTRPSSSSLIETYDELDNPMHIIDKLVAIYPLAATQFMNSQDCLHFLSLCKRPGQKPVTFVPCLDADFEVWFKKDSLWQSEDLDAVIDQDVGRVCILHGPVAAKYSTTTEESIRDILNRVYEGHVTMLKHDIYGDDYSTVPTIEYFGGKTANTLGAHAVPEGVAISETSNETRLFIPGTTLPNADEWMQLLAGNRATWRRALLTTDIVVRGHHFEPNPLRRLLSPSRGIIVEIAYPEDPSRTIISIEENIGGKQLATMKIGPISNTIIPLCLIEHRTATGRSVSLPLFYTYHPEAGYAPIRELTTLRDERIKDFYYKLWFGNGRPIVPLDAAISHTMRWDGGTTTVSSATIRQFARAVGNTAEAYIERPGRDHLAPMDFAILVGWKALMQPLFDAVDGDLLKLVHLSNRFRMIPGATPFMKGDVLGAKSEITAIVNQDSGQMVEVCGTITRDGGKPVMQVTSQFFYRGIFAKFEKAFQKKDETPVRVLLKSPKDVAVLKAKNWFKPEGAQDLLLGHSVVFKLHTLTRFGDKATFSSVKTTGSIEVEIPTTKELIHIGAVEYMSDGPTRGNPVLEYLSRHGSKLDQPVYLKHPIPIQNNHTKTPLEIEAPVSNENYARISGDFNPVHVSRVFSQYVNLPGTITHGMYTSGAVRSLVETWATENHAHRMRDYNVRFTGMVLPGDRLEIQLHHIGMMSGCMIIQIEVVKSDETREKVLVGEAIIEQPTSAYIFTGQGSQEKGMGMDLYEKSAVARDVWDRADRHFLNTFGFSILEIVRHDPKELTVYFGGARGKAIRKNYMEMTCQSLELASDGSPKLEKVFKTITEYTTSYTFRSPAGLLSATQFTQPALTLMQMAVFEDLRAQGVIQKDSVFAGHSLGEYSALASIAKVMPVETLVSVVFYRGLCMQVAVERDDAGRSNYSMSAVDPSRISPRFSEKALKRIVKMISDVTGSFLEIVNYNVRNMQYVCAGDLRGLDVLGGVLDRIKARDVDVRHLESEETHKLLVSVIEEASRQSRDKPSPLELSRGKATVPLRGIDVPFHSSYLRPGVQSFRSFLLKNLKEQSIDPEQLVGRYIPNLTARPFELTRDYFEYVHEMTQSPRIGKVLEGWI
ncbi:fatty acid synthase beta subunit [Annulohypoxylon maeteangense]|uniref:fatty acid synthase beta subunit n=1 Tax=Annulohypoxylon maeteangense TaxID=1927788 RepID=UPI002007261A|nr:fatty acid synthase beta subunit [Annulohypoxylon maeteangense]KAI0881211.1 fatty acid synthase beta subunit [Annulohypoxylon maeteangense]